MKTRLQSPLEKPSLGGGFTLVEILIAIGLLGLVLTAIFSSWTAILRATKTGHDAAASVQRSRIAVRTIEEALLCVQSFAANQPYYAFYAENGSQGIFSFVARLPKSFPRSGRFGDFDVRRVEFSVQQGAQSSKELVMRQKPLLMGKDFMDWDEDEKNYPLVLAKYVKDFEVEFWDKDKKDWVDEWKETKTNSLPQMVRLTLKLGDTAYSSQAQEQITRIISLPSNTVQRPWQLPMGVPGSAPPGATPPGSVPITPIPGQQPGQPGQYPGQPGQYPGGQYRPPSLQPRPQ